MVFRIKQNTGSMCDPVTEWHDPEVYMREGAVGKELNQDGGWEAGIITGRDGG